MTAAVFAIPGDIRSADRRLRYDRRVLALLRAIRRARRGTWRLPGSSRIEQQPTSSRQRAALGGVRPAPC